jgi:N-methylhydantoinase B/oxoprolinase/acetone carboxylase alpha subunit
MELSYLSDEDIEKMLQEYGPEVLIATSNKLLEKAIEYMDTKLDEYNIKDIEDVT